MPGPVALEKREYYGFSGNHFWKIIPALFGIQRLLSYPEKIELIRNKGIALWDVFKSCQRKTAADSDIECADYNNIPGLLKKYPNIKTIFLNSKTAEKTFKTRFSGSVKIPAYYLPSTSPANASVSFKEKLKKWSVILNYLK